MNRYFRYATGLTLVELMIAVTLSAAILAALATSWWLTAGFSSRVDRLNSTRLSAGDVVRLHRMIGAAGDPGGTGESPSFRLEPDPGGIGSRLTAWIDAGPMDAGGAVTDPCRLILRAGAYDGIHGELMFTRPDRSTEPGDSPMSFDLLQHAGSVEIRVLSPAGTWHDSWPNPSFRGLPRAVRFRCAGHPDPDAPFHHVIPDIIVTIGSAYPRDYTAAGDVLP